MEQHFLISQNSYAKFLLSMPLQHQDILEIGVGNGELTNLILKCDPLSIKGYEIDSNLTPPNSSKLELVYQDITKTDFSFLNQKPYWLISNPPYSLIPYIKTEVIDTYQLKGFIMMVPEKHIRLFPNAQLALSFVHTDFTPPTKPIRHHVIWQQL